MKENQFNKMKQEHERFKDNIAKINEAKKNLAQ